MSEGVASGSFASGGDQRDRARKLAEKREREKAENAARRAALEEETARSGLKSREERFDVTVDTFNDALTRSTVGLVSKADYGRLRAAVAAAAAPAGAPAAAETAKERAARKRKAEREKSRSQQRQRSALSFAADDDDEEAAV